MFKDQEAEAAIVGDGVNFPPAGLSHAQIIPDPLPDAAVECGPRKITRGTGFADRYGVWRERLALRLANADLAPDLARDIGSARWLRGVATLIGLSGIAIAGFPGFNSLEAAPAMQIDEGVRDEFRSTMIMPLALGADSGRRMGATSDVTPLARAPERPSLDLLATYSRGDGFDRMLRRAGVGDAEAQRVGAMIASAIPLADIAPGTQIDITLGRRMAEDAPRPLENLSFRARFDLQLAVERQGGRLVLDPRPIKVDTTPLRIRGTVGSGLYRSARAAGAPPRAVQQYLRALGAEINLERDISSTDEFDLIVDYRRAATGEVEAGELLYAGIIRNGRPHKQLMRWGSEGRFFEASGVGEVREGLIAPVPGRISSGFGMRRHPILGYRRMHNGLDFRAAHGTPIYAVTDGRVQMAGRNGGYGNYVRIAHDGGLATAYAHLSRIAVNNGASVKRGQVIGYVGSTGLSTGPHLHYEMYRNGRPIDPASVRFVSRAQLSGNELASFRARLSDLHKVEPGAALSSLAPDASAKDEPVREIDRLSNRQSVS